MESDLSLIEIAGEDDSLLQPIPNDGVSSLNSTDPPSDCFLCSPLQLLRSILDADIEKSSSSCTNSINVENSYPSKAEAPKLSVERQQMKKKKKGGGYNLRKSLAWDRAFFTEEGVLNSEELSMISGDYNKSSENMLSVIEEEGPNCGSKSSDMKALEENLFKELPPTSNKERSNGGVLLPKHALSPMVRRKVLSAHDVNRSGAKQSGCPRPVAPSSLKRPASSNTTKAATKDPKVSKLSILKPDPCAVSKAPKSATPGASGSKRNQMAQPEINILRKTGLKASSNNNRNVPNNLKPVPAGKSVTTKATLGQARRNVASSAKRLSTNSMLSPVSEADNSLEVPSNLSLPSARYASKADDGTSNLPLSSTRCASKADDGSRKVAILLPKKACNTGLSIQPQIAKPSGLRMPSPSLGFFGQPKAPSLRNPLNRNPQPHNLAKSTVLDSGNIGVQNPIYELRPPLVVRKIPEVVNDGAETVNVKVSCPNSGNVVPSTVNSALVEHIELVSKRTDMPNVEKKVQHDQNSCETMKKNNTLHRAVDMDQQLVELAESCISEMTSQMEGTEAYRNDKNCEDGPSNENQMLQTSNEDICAEVVDIYSKVQDSFAVEIENSNSSSHLQFIEKEKDDNRAINEVRTKSHAEDAGVQSLEGNSMDNQLKSIVAEVNEKCKHVESLSTFITGQQGSTDDASNLDDCLASASNFNSEPDKIVLHFNGSAEPDGAGTSKSEAEHFSACPIPLAMLDHGSNLDKLEFHNLDDTTADSKEVVDNHKLGYQFQHDIEQNDQPTYMESENMDEDQLTGAEKPRDVELTMKIRGHSNEDELEKPFSLSENLDNKENLLVDNSCHNSNLQPGAEFCYFHEDNAKGQVDMSTGRMNVVKHCEEETKLIVSSSSEISQIACGEKLSVEVHDLLTEGSQSPEESQKLNSGNSADVNYSGLDSPSSLSLYKNTDPTKKENNVAVGDALAQACNVSSLVGSCSCDGSPSRVSSQYLAVDKNKQSGDCELQNLVNWVEQSYIDNIPGSHLNATLVGNNSSEECKRENMSESAFKQCDGHENHIAQVMSVVQDSCLDSCTLNSEMPHELENAIPTDDINAGTKKESGNDKKKDTLLVKPPPNSVPFSDEWLAAFEAAGQEILTIKSGAVQNSPPDKSQPEPGPWSPVKRKTAQVIGPFDCTKYSNSHQSTIPHPPSPH